jgi:4-hydroxybenzoate polyprenyltransferase
MRPPSTLAVLSSITRPHIVAIATLACLTFGHVFSGGYPWLAAGLCALDWFLVNLLNRVVDFGEDRANAVAGTEAAWTHRRLIAWMGLSTLALSLVVQGILLPALLPWRLAYHALGLSYNWPLLPGKRRIKELYLAKNSASALGFVLTCFAYPLATAQAAGRPLLSDVTPATVALVAAFFFLFELSYEIIYDLRDQQGDAAAGLPTFPVVHGEAGARRIIDGLLLASLLFALGGWAAGLVPWRAAVMGAAPVMQAGLYRLMLRSGGVTSAHCVGLTWLGAALLAAYHAWELAGLPGAG